ncbi:uncharacterized protein LOC119670999 [Teleopsis dalmanni]|uniref:uncharacterized protein LOC119670999 n=1 Tax=Teleopsis dalmanni TaxID=139649 RepID=UPI0018CF82E4|nr:uncharacterized protein LOC119670999 [Teleopsis dalmanni]
MALNAVLSVVLTGASGYGLYAIKPDKEPYAFTACVITFCHGLVSFAKNVLDGDAGETAKSAGNVTTPTMQIVPVPLIDIELFLPSEPTNNLGWGHFSYVIPLALTALYQKWKDEADDENKDIQNLWDLTVYGGILSLIYYSVQENNNITLALSLIAWGTYVLPKQIEDELVEESMETSTLVGQSTIAAFMPFVFGQS